MPTSLARRVSHNRPGVPSIFSADPFGALRDEFDQMLTNWFSTSDNPAMLPAFAPSLDMNETETAYEVKIDLPGIKATDVQVQVSDNVLTISGERKCEKTDGKKNCGKSHYVERFHGTFSRSILLPAAVKQDKIDAQFRDGVLAVTLPKAEEAKPCQIAIKT